MTEPAPCFTDSYSHSLFWLITITILTIKKKINWIHYAIAPIVTLFLKSSCVIWLSLFSTCLFLGSLPLRLWQMINWMTRCISQVPCQVCFFLKDITFTYRSSAVDSSFFASSPIPPLLCPRLFLLLQALGNIVLIKKYYFLSVKMCYL